MNNNCALIKKGPLGGVKLAAHLNLTISEIFYIFSFKLSLQKSKDIFFIFLILYDSLGTF